MKRLLILLVVVLFASSSVAAQTSGSAQAEAKAGKAEAKVSADVSAKQEAQASKEKGKADAKAGAKGSAKSDASARAGEQDLHLECGSVIEAALTKSLDAKKNKVGDEVVARVTKDLKSNGRVIVPKNSRLLGRVTQAKVRGEGQSESAFGLEFDRVVMKDGREYPVNLAIQAVAAAQSAIAASAERDALPPAGGGMSRPAPAPRGNGGNVLGGVGSTVNSTVNAAGGVAGNAAGVAGGTVNSSAGGVLGADANAVSSGQAGIVGTLTSNSTGIIGLKDVALRSETVQESTSSVLVSPSRNVHLDSSTRFLLRSDAQASKQEARKQP